MFRCLFDCDFKGTWGEKRDAEVLRLPTLSPGWISPHIAVPLQQKRLISAEGWEPSRFTVHHGGNDVHQTVQSKEVPVLSVALHPLLPVCQLFSVRKRSGFTKIDHPDFGPARAVVDKQQGAADHLSDNQRRKTGKNEK